jgi:hypothetical protein
MPLYQPLDRVPLAVEGPIAWPCAASMLPAWNRHPAAMLARVPPEVPVAAPLIAADAVGPAFRTAALAPLHRPAGHERWEDRGLMALARRPYQRQALAIPLGAAMHFATASAVAAA